MEDEKVQKKINETQKKTNEIQQNQERNKAHMSSKQSWHQRRAESIDS